MSGKCLIAKYHPHETVYLIPEHYDLSKVNIRRQNIYYDGKNVTDVVKSVELESDFKMPCDVYVNEDMRSFFEEKDLMEF
jgi:hypothetical protein